MKDSIVIYDESGTGSGGGVQFVRKTTCKGDKEPGRDSAPGSSPSQLEADLDEALLRLQIKARHRRDFIERPDIMPPDPGEQWEAMRKEMMTDTTGYWLVLGLVVFMLSITIILLLDLFLL